MASLQQQEHLSSSEREKIRAAVNDIVLVDGHAHNLVELDSSFSFVQAFTEAEGAALADVPHTLSFKSGIEHIAKLYNVQPTLESVEEFRRKTGLAALTAKCFGAANISTVLLDDGLSLDKKKDLAWHKDSLGDVHRILRIETLAENILNQGPSGGGDKWTLNSFTDQFLAALKSQVSSVVAFKSIAAYRSGLNINPSVTEMDAEDGLMQTLGTSSPIRLVNKNIIDWIFTRSLELATSSDIPMQIHTGFGDKDLDLQLVNPVLLRAVLEDPAFERARIVLLHASYPYMRQAAYLSTVYPQVFLDFGLVIPKLSKRGMKTAVAELLELAPINKVMFSTDACGFPESYYLGAKQARTVLADVLCDCVEDGDLTGKEAIAAAQSMLRSNSLSFYKLKGDQTTQETGAKDSGRGDKVCQGSETLEASLSCLDNTKYVRVMWADASGQRRCRVVPTDRFKKVTMKDGVSLPECVMAMSSHSDGPAADSGLTASGAIRLVPDLSTLIEVPQWKHGLALGDMHVKPGIPWELCPRTTLRRLSDLLEKEFQLVLHAGFEAEFYILKKVSESGSISEKWEGVDFTPYCSTSGLNQSMGTLDCILTWLHEMQIDVEQFHPEAGGGQFEIVWGHQPVLKAGDSLLIAREAIVAAAISQNLHATFLPKLNLKNTAFGNGSHVHISLWKGGKNVFGAESEGDSFHGISETGRSFLAGVLEHLPAVLAFTAPHPNSYKRIQPQTWSGAFQCWGEENKEAPLRTCGTPGVADSITNFELKAFDGCANPHLGLAAVIAAGLDGLRRKLQLPPPVNVDPSLLEKQNIVKRLPSTANEAAQSLEDDETIRQLMGEKLVKSVLGIRRAEADFYLRRSQENLIFNY